MRKFNLLLASLTIGCSIIGQQLVSISSLATYSASIIQQSLSGTWNTSNMDINPVKSYKVTYNTTDAQGNPTVASGAVYIPNLTNCDYAPITAYDHGTEFIRNNVPSRNDYVGQGLYFSTTGYITVMPDYLGLGDHPGIHLYQHSETEATATLDLVRAVRQYLDTATNELKDNGQFFITGYSQGGHAAMATNKYIEDNSLQNEFDVIACAPMSGAFDQTGAQFDLIFDGDSSYYAPSFLPYVLGSYQEAYGNIYQNFTDIYDASHAASIEIFLNGGNKTFTQWNTMLGLNYYDFMVDTVLENMLADVNRDSHRINVALRANNLYDWVPQNPIKMLYCGSDSLVSPQNSINTLDTMLTLGATEVEALNLLQSGDHNSCFVPATTYTLTWFDSLAVKCLNYASVEAKENNDISLYPNPVRKVLTIKGVNLKENTITIYSSIGQIFNLKVKLSNKIEVSELPVGVYFLSIANNNGEVIQRLKFIKQ